ncbi:unnamed protein product [Caretta caretta]
MFLYAVKELGECEIGKFQQPVEISPELENRLSDFSQKNIALMETLRKFTDSLGLELETERGESLGSHRQDVTEWININMFSEGLFYDAMLIQADPISVCCLFLQAES